VKLTVAAEAVIPATTGKEVVVTELGEQSAVPPELGTNACAPIK
jgi:hypothetical protein